MTLRSFGASLVRTISPLVAGFLLTYLVRLGIEIETDTAVLYTYAALSALYYTLIRALEARFPIVGILLGYTVQPEYPHGPSS